MNVRKNEIHYFTFSVKKDYYKKNINQRYYSDLKEDGNKLKRNLFQNYKSALNFEAVYGLVEDILSFPNENVAYFNMNANYKIAEYLGIKTKITCTDIIDDNTFWEKFNQLDHENRMIYMCKYFNQNIYINAINGRILYHKNIFAEEGIELKFIKMDEIKYPQFSGQFISNLSILDVIMHNKVEDVKKMLGRYQLV